MQIAGSKITRRSTPPGASVELVDQSGQTISIELKGEEFGSLSDVEIMGRARLSLSAAGNSADTEIGEAGTDQTLERP